MTNTPMYHWAVLLRQAINDSVRNQEVDKLMPLIIPDRDRPQRDDLIWAMPVTREKFAKWQGLAEQQNHITPGIHGGVRYVTRVEDGHTETLLVLPMAEHTDEDVLQACAYLRLVEGYNCRFYILRQQEDT